MSGAGNYLFEVERDLEEREFLAKDGSSGELLASRLQNLALVSR